MAIQLTEEIKTLFEEKGLNSDQVKNLKTYLTDDNVKFINENKEFINGELLKLAENKSQSEMQPAFLTFKTTIESKKVSGTTHVAVAEQPVALKKVSTERNPYLLRMILNALYMQFFQIRKPSGAKFSQLHEQLKDWLSRHRERIDTPLFAVFGLDSTQQKEAQQKALMKVFSNPYLVITPAGNSDSYYVDMCATTLAIEYQRFLFEPSGKLTESELREKLMMLREKAISEVITFICEDQGYDEAEIADDVRANFDYGMMDLALDTSKTV